MLSSLAPCPPCSHAGFASPCPPLTTDQERWMMGRYWSRNLSWKWGSLGQEEGYFQLTWSRRGARGMGSTTKPSGGSGLTAWERTGSPCHTALLHRGVLGSPLPPGAG